MATNPPSPSKLSSDLALLQQERDTLVRQILASQRSSSLVHQAPDNDDKPDTDTNMATDAVTETEITAALLEAKKVRAEHIRALGRYNDIKDAAQMLIGLVADSRGCRVREVMRDLGVEDDDDL